MLTLGVPKGWARRLTQLQPLAAQGDLAALTQDLITSAPTKAFIMHVRPKAQARGFPKQRAVVPCGHGAFPRPGPGPGGRQAPVCARSARAAAHETAEVQQGSSKPHGTAEVRQTHPEVNRS